MPIGTSPQLPTPNFRFSDRGSSDDLVDATRRPADCNRHVRPTEGVAENPGGHQTVTFAIPLCPSVLSGTEFTHLLSLAVCRNAHDGLRGLQIFFGQNLVLATSHGTIINYPGCHCNLLYD